VVYVIEIAMLIATLVAVLPLLQRSGNPVSLELPDNLARR